MALFGGIRDMDMFRKINKEIIYRVIDVEVLYYKFNVNDTKVNIYDEAKNKTYYPPVLTHVLIQKEDQEWNSDDFGPNVGQPITLAFLRDELLSLDIVPEVGDIIEHNAAMYEIDTVVQNQRFMGRDPDMWFGGDTHGYNISIICTGHMTRLTNLNIVQSRFDNGLNGSNDISLPRNV